MNKKYIIKKAEDFNHIINSGKYIKGEVITIYYYPSSNNKKYFGFAIGKKIGNAVTRNKVKRKIKALISKKQLEFSNMYKYIIMLRKDCLSFSNQKWEDDLDMIIRKVNSDEKI